MLPKELKRALYWGELTLSEGGEHFREIDENLICVIPFFRGSHNKHYLFLRVLRIKCQKCTRGRSRIFLRRGSTTKEWCN